LANNRIVVKRTSTAGRTPNTTAPANLQYIAAGELALNMVDKTFFTSDGTNLIYVGANVNSLYVSTNTATIGTAGYFVSNGYVGIGTASPTQKLDVSASGVQTVRVATTDTSGTNVARFTAQYTGGGGGTASAIDLRAGDGYTYLDTQTNTPMLFGTNDIEKMRIAANGNVGIGTTAPGALLTVDGGIMSFTNYSGTSQMRFQYAAGTKASPTAVSTQSFLGAMYGLAYDGTTYRNAGHVGVYSDAAVNATSSPGFLLFATTPIDTVASTEKMRITSNGYVGIGFTVPSYKFSVSGDTYASGNSIVVGTVNAASYTVGTAFTANSTVVNAVAYYSGTLLVANTSVINATHLGGTIASGYQTTAGLSANVATLTANNANNLGTVAAANYVQNTDSRTLSGNLVISGTYFNPSANTILLGNSTQRWVLSANTGDFSGNVNVTGNVTASLFVGNLSGSYANLTGQVNAASLLLSTNTATIGTGSYFVSNGNVGVGTNVPSYKLQVNGSFAATTKSFIIDHPTKLDMKLRYGSLEGPENGVYVRGRTTSSVITLPDHWEGLVDPGSITVSLTPIGKSIMPSVFSYNNKKVVLDVANNVTVDCFYHVFGERKDVDKLVVEF